MIFELTLREGLLLRRALKSHVKDRQKGIDKFRARDLDGGGYEFLNVLVNEQEARVNLLARLDESFPDR